MRKAVSRHGMDQTVFETVYRGRQGALNHMAYMRTGKVLLALRALAQAGIRLSGKSVFDYGFGAGTFYRYCPKDSRLFGVEMDEQNVRDVQTMLTDGGWQADLQKIDLAEWNLHPLLKKSYDVFLCSHVLEHLPDPVDFLRAVRPAVAPDGVFLGLVPVNEWVTNPHHVHSPDRAMVTRWMEAAGYELLSYEENDPFTYHTMALFAVDSGWRRVAAQAVSLGLGIPASLMGGRAWFALGTVFAKLTGARPVQAVFLCRPLSAPAR